MRAARWIRATEGAVVLLLVCALAAAAAESRDHFGRARAKKVPDHAIQASAGPKKPVLDVRNAAPGDFGTRRVTLANVGKKASRVEFRRIRMVQSALTPYLSINLYDSTTRECLYPKPKKQKPVKKGGRVLKPRPSGPCKSFASWRNLPPRMDLLPLNKGKYVVPGNAGLKWKRREKHVLVLNWRIDPKAPNAAAGKSATFTLRYRARKR